MYFVHYNSKTIGLSVVDHTSFLHQCPVHVANGMFTRSSKRPVNVCWTFAGSCKPGPDLAGGRPGTPGGRPGPSGVFGISERDWLSNYRVLKIERFGGRPPVGGRHGARPPQIRPWCKHHISCKSLNIHVKSMRCRISEVNIYANPAKIFKCFAMQITRFI